MAPAFSFLLPDIPSVYIISTVCTTYVKAEASFRDEKDFLFLQEKYSEKL